MTKKEIREKYRAWRKANGNQLPNRAVVKMYWEDGDNTEKGYQVDTISLNLDDIDRYDEYMLFYANGLKGLLALTTPNNGSDFVVTEVEEFYKEP